MLAAKAPQAKNAAPAEKLAGQAQSSQQTPINPVWAGLALSVQTKLAVGAADDPLEREADAVAERVMRMSEHPGTPPRFSSAPASLAQRKCAACSAEDEKLQRKENGSGAEPVAQADPGELTQGGQPLPSHLRGFFEPRFGRDLSDVRLHSGVESGALNDQLHARAFTYGNHIWLGQGHAPRADFLMAHEMAHVVQQRQPRMLARAEISRDIPKAGAAAPRVGRAGPSIQRLGLSDPFWIPLGGSKGMLGGRDLHDELLTIAKNNNPKLDSEAPAPNANRKDHGLGLQGSIDLYQGDTMPGLYFDGLSKGDQHPDPDKTTPKKHYRAAMTGPKASRFKPFVKDGVIHDIDKGPKNPLMGELKPAVSSMLSEGDTQLGHYAEGMKMAANLTDEWVKRNKKTGSWAVGTPGRLGDGDVKFVDGGTDLKFDPASPRDDFKLVLGTVRESISRPGKYELSVRFNPEKYKLPPIMGGVYAQKFTGGAEGLWMYFARPKNLDEYLKTSRAALNTKGEMVLANLVQDQVIDPMFKAPEKIAKLGKAGPPLLARPAPLLQPRIQRAPKTPNLKDDFKFSDWAKKQGELRKQISGPAATEDTKQQVAAMELLHKAYETDAALGKVSGTGKSTLPAKGTDLANIVTGTGKDQKTHKKELSDLGGWLKGWTGRPAEILGLFREKFGTSFVWVANKFVKIKESIQKKFHELFHKQSGVSGKSGKAKMILQALGKALKQAAKILVPQTLHLVMDAIEAGLKKKLAKVFDLDPEKMLDEAFGGEFRDWNQKLDEYKAKAESYVKDTFEEYTKDLGWIKDLIDLGKEVGPILEAGIALLQCVSPPVWGCLKLLAKKLNDCAIAKAMNICSVQMEIADLTMKIKPLKDLPSDLAQKIMDLLKKVSPKGLEDIFDEPVAKPPAFNSGEIECEFTELPPGCPNWGLIELEGGKGAPPKEDKDGKDDGKDSSKDSGQSDKDKEPDQGGSDKQPDADKPPPDADQKSTEPPPAQGGDAAPKGEPAPEDEATQKMKDFLDKLNKEELDELHKEAKRQKLLDKPFDPQKAEELLDKVRKKIKARKEAEAKNRAEEEERKKKEPGGKEDKGGGGKAGPGSATTCVWNSSMLSVGGYLLRAGSEDILDEGHTNDTPFSEKTVVGCGGLSTKFKYDFYVSSGFCERPAPFTKPVVSLNIHFKSASTDKELFKKTEANPWSNGILADPGWGSGSRVDLGNINANGVMEINVTMKDPDTGVTKTISGKIPVDVNCS